MTVVGFGSIGWYYLSYLPQVLDSDNDGLVDALEARYRTNPQVPDTDGDGLLDGFELAAGTDPLKPSIYPHLNKARQATKDMTPKIQKVKANYDKFYGIEINKDWNSVRRGTESFRADIQPTIDGVNSYQITQADVSQAFYDLMRIWSNASVSPESRLQALREFNQSHMSQAVVDYSGAKGTLAWHINEKQEAELSTFNQDQNAQHFQSVSVLGQEGLGLSRRLTQLVMVGNFIYDQADKSADIFVDFRPKYTTAPDDFVPGYISLKELKKALSGATKQLQSQLSSTKEDIEGLGKTYTDSKAEYSIQPWNRATLNKLLNNLTDSETAEFLKIISEDNSDFGIIQLVNILDKAANYDKQISGIISKGLRIGSIKTLSDFCHVGNDVISPLEAGYNIKFAPENYELLQNIEKKMNPDLFSDIELARLVLELVPNYQTWDRRNIRLFNSAMQLEGRKVESCIDGMPSWYRVRSIVHSDSDRYMVFFEYNRPHWIFKIPPYENYSPGGYTMYFKPFLDGNLVVDFAYGAFK